MTINLSVGPSFNLSPGSSKTLPIAIINPEDTEVTYTIEVTYIPDNGGKNWLILDRYSGTLIPHEIQTLFVTANTKSMKLGNFEAVLNFFTTVGHEKLDDLSIELHVSRFTYGDNGPHSAVVSMIQNALAPASGTKNTFSLQVINPQENNWVTWTMSTGGVDWVSVNPSEGKLEGGGQTEVVVTTDKNNLQAGTYRTDLILTITFDPNPENHEPSSVLYPVKLAIPSKTVPTLSSPKGNLKYHGGHLLTAVEVFTIFWGFFWEKENSDVIKGVNDFFDYIVTSPLIDLLCEYSVPDQVIGKGRRTGTVTITSTEPGQIVAGGSREIDDTEIQRALQGWIDDGTIPQPNLNTLYFVYLPPGVTAVLNGERSCTNFCGYHEVINNTIFYAVEPFMNCKGCNFGQIINSLTKVSSHELCEAITDPALDGWHENRYPNNEIGDICNHDVQQLNGYTIQSEWSNKANACRIEP